MTVLLKYCGGCNPVYDRAALVEQLRQEFPDVEFLYASSGLTEADIVLVVCGCPVRCASQDTLRGRLHTLMIDSPREYTRVGTLLSERRLRPPPPR
ncbi:MAG: hypothetical protein LBU28_10835 [Spirochaetaceae bacterium]|jgi:hypothetical protein|nr:hypothetical protein [Spirochaetaceae bacterium]